MKRTAALAMVVLAACSSATEPDWRRVIGTIDPSLSVVQLVSGPTEATAGEPFTITVRTIGSSSCTQEDGATVEVETDIAIVTAWDLVAVGGVACTDDLGVHPRDVTITFANAGDARIRIIGRTLVAGDSTSYEFTIPVRPSL